MLSYFNFTDCLEHLFLDVSCNSNVTDRDLIALCQKIPVINKLKTITFNFDFCKKVTEDAI
jgi:hypothetical protein